MAIQQEKVVQDLKKRFVEKIKEVSAHFGDDTVVIERDSLLDIINFLKAKPYDFAMLLDLTCVDYMGQPDRFEMVYHLFSLSNNLRLPETFGMKKFKPQRSSFPEIDEEGWRGRVSKQIFGSKSKKSKVITEIISKGYSSFQFNLDSMKDILGVKIDPNVTMDIHRIFRLPGSLNSKSGLTKILCKDLEKFNPFLDGCFIDDEKIDVIANCPIEFKLKNKKFGPYDKEKTSIPKYAAIYLICKGFANCA